MRLAEPAWLTLMVLAAAPWILSRLRRPIQWPTLDGFGPVGRRRARAMASVPLVLRGVAVACVVVALARPQSVGGRVRIAGEGVAVVVALDVSSSMTRGDFPEDAGAPPVTRLDAARRTLAAFVAGRADDLLGLVAFANYPDLTCPPTLDHRFLLDTVRALRPARPGDDGTNLGDALVVAADALRRSATRARVLVLVTDGRNGPAVPDPADPVAAADAARKLGVTVYTVAVGGRPVTPGLDAAEADGPDLDGLERIATAGGGKAFVATEATALRRIFGEIDALEKSPVHGVVWTRYREEYVPWAAAAVALIVVDRVLAAGRRLRRLP